LWFRLLVGFGGEMEGSLITLWVQIIAG
jgi:hypothetical protein